MTKEKEHNFPIEELNGILALCNISSPPSILYGNNPNNKDLRKKIMKNIENYIFTGQRNFIVYSGVFKDAIILGRGLPESRSSREIENFVSFIDEIYFDWGMGCRVQENFKLERFDREYFDEFNKLFKTVMNDSVNSIILTSAHVSPDYCRIVHYY